MAGHSKWANIKHKKAAEDKKRGKLFTKLARAIAVAAREGGGDPEVNFTLRLAIDKAKAANMPNDNIERAIARGTGADKGDDLQRITYEGYGPQGVAVIVSTLTDNRNRTVAELRTLFTRFGGSLGESNSVAWQFEQRGMISVPANGVEPDELALEAIDAGAVDVEVDTELVTVYTDVKDFQTIKDQLSDSGYKTEESELAMVPTVEMQLDERQTMQVLKFLEELEELDDVDQVWTNLDIDDTVAEQYAAA